MKTLLIIEDDPALLRGLTRILGRYYDVTATSSGEEALCLLREGRSFDVILSDYHMPGMTGGVLYGHLHEELPEMASRVVFMSGGFSDPQCREFMASVPNPVLIKPFEPEDLARVIPA